MGAARQLCAIDNSAAGAGGEPPRGPFDAMRKLASERPHLFPADSSAGAFIDWLIRDGCHGEWQFNDLLDDYVELCRALGWKPVAKHVFASSLKHIGLEQRQLDLRRNDGSRYRPTVYVLPEREP